MGESSSYLPPGYRVEAFEQGHGGPLAASWAPPGSVVWLLMRPDDSPVASIPPEATQGDVEREAWDDHRRRTLRVLAGGRSQGCTS